MAQSIEQKKALTTISALVSTDLQKAVGTLTAVSDALSSQQHASAPPAHSANDQLTKIGEGTPSLVWDSQKWLKSAPF